MTTFDDILASAVPPRATVSLCMRGDLRSDLAQALKELADLERNVAPSLGGTPEEQTLRALVARLADEVREASIDFVVQGINQRTWNSLVDANPPRENAPGDRALGYNPMTLFDQLVAACLITPDLTAEQVTRLQDTLSAGQWDQLCDAALTVARRHTKPPVAPAAE